MRVELLAPDVAPANDQNSGDGAAFTKLLDGIGTTLDGATSAEDAYAAGSGSLQQAIYERARADVALPVAAAAAQRAAQSVQTILNMQM
jgi:hypothetical protein